MTDLTKWPRLLVVGDPVTPQQANEILIRTDLWTGFGYDPHFEDAVYAMIGLDLDPYSETDWNRLDKFRDSINAIPLSYLYNDRIASSWVGGPFGWCNWDGTIGCSTFNIGKWPSVEGVLQEWQDIAAAFPYLNLTAQLVPDEGEAGLAAVTFRIEGEMVSATVEDAPLIRPVEEFGMDINSLINGRGSIGVSLKRLAEALEQVRHA